MQAIILAAGTGNRLKELTEKTPKCMLPIDGTTIIERQLRQLDNLKLQRIIIVDGFLKNKLESFINSLNIQTPISFINNPSYASSNNIYSLSLTKEFLNSSDTILMESDIIFPSNILQKLIATPYKNVAIVSEYKKWMDGTAVSINKDYGITRFIPKKSIVSLNGLHKTVNIYKLSKSYSEKYLIPLLETFVQIFGINEYYEQVFRLISEIDNNIMHALTIDPNIWYEIDTQEDLRNAKKLLFKK